MIFMWPIFMFHIKNTYFKCSCGQTGNIFFCKVAVLPSPLATSEELDPTPSENYSGADFSFFLLKKYHQDLADELLSKKWSGWVTEWIPLRIRLMITRAPAVLKMFREGEK